MAPTNRQLCAGWLEWLRAHGRQTITVYQYGLKLEELLAHLDGKPLSDVTLSDLEAWVSRPRKGRGNGQLGADATRAKDVTMLSGLWKWGVAHGYFRCNPTLDLERPSVRNEAPHPVPEVAWERFWGSALDDDVRAVYGLQLFGGLRRHEVSFLRPEHFDFEEGVIKNFKRKGDRNSKVSGVTPIVSCALLFEQKLPHLLPDAAAFLGPLRALVEAGNEWLVPWGEEVLRHNALRPVRPRNLTTPDQIGQRLEDVLRALGMKGQFTPHMLRHGFCSYLLRAGVRVEVVSRLANHSSLNVTLRYVKLADDPLAELLEPSLRGSRWQVK